MPVFSIVPPFLLFFNGFMKNRISIFKLFLDLSLDNHAFICYNTEVTVRKFFSQHKISYFHSEASVGGHNGGASKKRLSIVFCEASAKNKERASDENVAQLTTIFLVWARVLKTVCTPISPIFNLIFSLGGISKRS